MNKLENGDKEKYKLKSFMTIWNGLCGLCL